MVEKPCFWPLGYIFSVKTFEFSIKDLKLQSVNSKALEGKILFEDL